MRWLTEMDWPTRLAWGLLAWPVTIALAILLGHIAQPGQPTAAVLLVGALEVGSASIAISFTVWAIITWFERND